MSNIAVRGVPYIFLWAYSVLHRFQKEDSRLSRGITPITYVCVNRVLIIEKQNGAIWRYYCVNF